MNRRGLKQLCCLLGGACTILAAAQLVALEPGTKVVIPEGDFEQQGKLWQIPDDGFARIVEDEGAHGRYCLLIEDKVKNGGSNVSSRRFPVPGRGVYRLSGMVRADSGNGLGVYVRQFDERGALISGESHVIGLGGSDQDWATFQNEFMVSKRAREFEVWIHSYQAAVVTAAIDNLEIEYVTGPDDVTEADMATVKQRLRERVAGGTPAVETIDTLISALQPDGHWAAIDYADDSNAAWQPSHHMGHLLSLARAFADPEMPAELRAKAMDAIGRGLDYWYEHDFTCPNWWYNQIGVPRQLYRIMLLTEDELTPAQTAAGLKILERAKLGMTGQNLVWVAEVTVARGCLAREPMVVWEAFRRMEQEIRVSTSEGIQPDWSFYQHGEQLYSGGYGRGFSQDCPYFASLAHETSFAFSEEKIEILANYLLEGQQWMTRGQRFDYSACGREITRRRSARAHGLASACRNMAMVDTERADEYEAFAQRVTKGITPETPALVGHKHFWRVDFSVHHRPDWYASVRVTSPRLIQTETCNQENVIGALLSDGVNYILTDGDDYEGIFPVWDWKRLPGITVLMDDRVPATRGGARGKHAFAGGVSDSRYGCTGMVFERGSLQAHKGWFFFDDGYACLGSDIRCDADDEVITAANQCLLKGPVTVATPGAIAPFATGEATFDNLAWVHHGGIGYVPLSAVPVTVKNELQVGSWQRINRQYPDAPVSLDVFSLWFHHGAKPQGEDYAYAVVAADTPEQVEAFAQAPSFEIVSNTADVQAVLGRGAKVLQAIFYDAGALTSPSATVKGLAVDRPCMLVLAPGEDGIQLSVSDPSLQADTVTIVLEGRFRGGDNVNTDQGRTRVVVGLPVGEEFGGSSVSTTLYPVE